MALKPIKRLTVSQVIRAREMYFRDLDSLSYIAHEFDMPKATIQKVVHGIGKFYASIDDGIPQEVKDNRLPRRQQFSRSDWRNLGKMQEDESARNAARHRREEEEREAKQKAIEAEERRKLIERLIREDQMKKNK